MATAFSVTFIESEQHLPVTAFYTSPQEMTDEVGVTLKENVALQIVFHAPAGSRLYLNELQETTLNYFVDDQGEPYIAPRSEPYCLYEFKQNQMYPFTYGRYEAKCVLADDTTHYFSLHVDSKLYGESHQQMIADIEQFMKGMSYSKKKRALVKKTMPDARYEKAFRTILQYPFEQLERQYTLTTDARGADFRTAIYAATHPEETRHYVPRNVLNRQTLENEWLKQFVKYNQAYMKQQLAAAKNDAEKRLLMRALQVTAQFLAEPWVQELGYPRMPLIPAIFQQQAAYRTIYAQYRQLRKQAGENVVYGEVRSYKKSADLYEIWGYLYVAQQLVSMGYTMTQQHLSFEHNEQGVVFDNEAANYMVFEKGSQLIRLFFENAMPRYQRDITPLKPLATFHNNLPDCRLDFWQHEQYKSSHIIDFKYRRLEQIYQKDGELDRAFKQLTAYALATQSNTAELNGTTNRSIDRNPVDEAWGVYPFMHSSSTDALREQVMRLLPLTPGERNPVFCQQLRDVVERGFAGEKIE